MLDPVIKEVWIEALLSDEYDQITRELCIRDESGYVGCCALGVLLAEVVGIREEGEPLFYSDLELLGVPPLAQVQVWKLNDSGHTFEEIAEWIKVML